MDEEQLINLLRQGDDNAFRTLFDTYYAMLCHVASRILRDDPAAEAVADDVMFALWQHRQELDRGTQLKAYLLRAVKNRCINELRSVQWRMAQASDRIDSASEADLLSSLFADEGQPLGTLLCGELEQRLAQAIDSLQPQCRAVFTMSRYQQKSYKEIADELGISVNTVKYHMKNALALLSDQLKDYIAWAALLLLSA